MNPIILAMRISNLENAIKAEKEKSAAEQEKCVNELLLSREEEDRINSDEKRATVEKETDSDDLKSGVQDKTVGRAVAGAGSASVALPHLTMSA